MSEKLVLIDGHSILNRAFYGVPDLTNAKGFHTNAIYGFLNIMFKILEEEKPQYLVVAFDRKEKTFRHEMYDAYKGTRKPMPEELRQQVPVMKEILTAMQIKIMEKPGLEADDILGTLAKTAEKDGMDVSLVSGDRDLLQIATEHIKIRIPKTKGGRTEVEDYYAKDVLEKYQVTPEQFIELKALMGDTADNIPGVPKIGEKTATSLLLEYHTIDGIYEHLEEISKKSVKQTLSENRELADLSKALATIEVHAELDFTFAEAKMENPYTKEAYAYFQELEFKNMLGRFDNAVKETKLDLHFQYASTEEELKVILEQCKKADYFSYFFVEGAPRSESQLTPLERMMNGEKESEIPLLGVALTWKMGETVFIKGSSKLEPETLLQHFSKLIQEKERGKAVSFDIKKSYIYTYYENEMKEQRETDTFFDVKLAAYLLNPLKSEYTVEDVANEYVGVMLEDKQQLFGKQPLSDILYEKPDEFLQYACIRSYFIYEAYEKLAEALKNAEMEDLYYDMEMPLTYILHEMEREGVIVKGDELDAYAETLTVKIDELEQKIYDTVGEKFNINSPKQLGEILFGKMQIPGGKKTKTGYSTAADVLEKLAPAYPVVSDILEYRTLTKLKSTYAVGLQECIKEDGRIHTSFNQMITATGRISSTEPNLQNIPMRMELGRLIRKVFVPKQGCVLMDADYSQIELRILAHMSQDEALIEAYRTGEDIHRITASQVFHTPFEEVTDLQRRNAKAVNFGIVYGISAFGLSEDLGVSRKEAADYIERYFHTYPKIKAFLDGTVEQAKEQGYSVTLFGRKRPIPELKSSNYMQRQFGERVAMNAPIQGTAADIMKVAMIKVFWELRRQNLESKMILQVHDELVIETKEEEKEAVEKILVSQMEQAAELAVFLDVDCHCGKNWYEAK